METFRGKGHQPGTDRERDIEVEIDWKTKDVSVHIEGVAEGVIDWPGLVTQTFGPMDEIVFRTKGIPRLFTHWWHFVRSRERGFVGNGSRSTGQRWRLADVYLAIGKSGLNIGNT